MRLLPNPLAALDDRALLARFADLHEQAAFEQLVKRHGRLVFGVCRRVVRDAHLAEDAFQATFLVLAKNPGRAAEASSIGGWLFGVARRVGLAARRQARRRARREARALAPDPVPPDPHLGELQTVLDAELATLPDDLRAALIACFLEERTHDEAARELGWSLSTLRRRLDRGKELLRDRLARRGVALGAGLLVGALAAPGRAAVPALNPTPAAAALANAELGRGFGPQVGAAACLAVVLAVGGAALGWGSAPEPPQAVPPSVPRIPALAVAPEPRPARGWVTVSGRVVWPKGREVPAPKPVVAARDAGTWKPFAPLVDECLLVDLETRGLANAVVWLRPDSDDRHAPFPKGRVHPALAAPGPAGHTVTATHGQFVPRVLAVRAGDTVAFANQLTVPTNVRYDAAGGGDEPEFNVLLGRDAAHTPGPRRAAPIPDAFRSSIHPWMVGFVWAFEHPYFAVTDARGRFEIAHAPPGRWRLVVWHEAAGFLGGAPGRLGTAVELPAARTGRHELTPAEFVSDRWPAE